MSSTTRKSVSGMLQAITWGMTLLLLSGFDFSKHSIPLDEIHNGGPGKDGIPALLKPEFVSASGAAPYMRDRDRILGLVLGDEPKAYPIKILNWHEIVNDEVGGHPVVVTFCPLCGTGMVFDSWVQGKKLTFGVSGFLYQSDLLLYDHKTESLWSQIEGKAVTGPLTGARLKLLSSMQTTWGNWKKKHPNTRVLSRETGYHRNYDRDPYEGYYTSSRLMFGVNQTSRAFHPKEKVLGIELGGKFKAYPFSELARAEQPVEDNLNGTPVRVYYDNESRTAVIRDAKGKDLPSVVGFWFAWYAFHPDTEVFRESRQ